MGKNRPKIERLELEGPDLNAERAAALKELFPEAVAEGKIDFAKLREALGDYVDERPERYSFSWSGKRDANRLLQAPSRATLKPAREESVDFDKTKHLFIEGDNLEVLKLLYKAYAGRVKMIYIDPPYNTGKDFIYPDNFADPLDTYLRLTGQKDAEGNLLTSNPETSGRYHSAWLSMMYPRLFIARQLLREDGVIFVSINDVEYAHVRLLLDMIFGDESFIGTFIWKSRHNVDSRDKAGISSDHEYIVCYGKKLSGKEKDLEKYKNPDSDLRGPWMSDNMVGLATKDKRPNLHYDLIDPETGINYGCPEKGWRYEPKSMKQKIKERRILWPSSSDGRPRHKKFLHELESQYTGLSTFLDAPTTSAGTQELRALFRNDIFDFPKPSALLKALVKQAGEEGQIYLDFFAGACPFAQAVLEANCEDQQGRQFLVIQIPEPLEDNSPASQIGYQTIAAIGKERIRRVIKKLKSERDGEMELQSHAGPKHQEDMLDHGDTTTQRKEKPSRRRDVVVNPQSEDLGFRVFKLAESHFQRWTGLAERDADELIDEMARRLDPLGKGWNATDVLWEIAIREGLSLSSRIERLPAIKTNAVWRIADDDKSQSLLVCLDEKLKPETPRALNLDKDTRFLCRDAALTDELAANVALQCRLKTI